MKGFVSQALALIGMAGSMGGPWKSSVATGVRTTAAVVVPLVIGQLAGDTALAMMVGIGGLNVSLADIGGPYRMKAVTMGVATIGLAAAAFLGTVVGRSLWLSLPLMFLLASAAGLAGLYGNAAAKVSFLSLIFFILMVGMPAGVTEAAERSIALVGGGLWPSWERERLPEQLARTIAANRDYFLGVIAGYRGQTSDPAALRSTRAQAQLENANAAAAFQRLLSEPEVQHGPIGPTYALVTYNQRFYDSVTTLAVNLPAVTRRDILPGLETFTKSMEVMLRTLENAVPSGRLPAEFPACEASLGAAQAYIRQLTTRGVARAATEQPDRLNDNASRGIAFLSSELDRLADEVVGMSRAVNLGAQRHGEPR